MDFKGSRFFGKMVLILCLFNFASLFAQESVNQLEVVFIAKFANFINWPDSSGINDLSEPFVITVIGNSSIDKYLKELFVAEKQKMKGKRVKLRFIQSVKKITDCNVLFIAESEKKNLKRILTKVKNKPILTISDTPGFAEAGTIINFYISEGQKLRFEINYKKSLESKISISSRLLKIAKVVE